MSGYKQMSSRLPEAVYEQFTALEHGSKQLACAAGLLLYFECDEETRWLYREWAEAIAAGRADLRTPPENLRTLFQQRRRKRTKK